MNTNLIPGPTVHKCGPFPTVPQVHVLPAEWCADRKPRRVTVQRPPAAHTLWRCETCGQWWYRHPNAPLGGRTPQTLHLPELWCEVRWWHFAYRRQIKAVTRGHS